MACFGIQKICQADRGGLGGECRHIQPLRPDTASRRLDLARRGATCACPFVPGRVRLRRRSNSVLSRMGTAGRSRPPQGLLASRSIGRRSKDSEPESKTGRSRLWSYLESFRMRRLAFSGAMEGLPWRVLLSSHALSLDAYCRERSGRSVPAIKPRTFRLVVPCRLLLRSERRLLWRYADTVSS